MYNTVWQNPTATVTADTATATVFNPATTVSRTILGDFAVAYTKQCSVCGHFSEHATVVSSEFWLCDSCLRKLKILLADIID